MHICLECASSLLRQNAFIYLHRLLFHTSVFYIVYFSFYQNKQGVCFFYSVFSLAFFLRNFAIAAVRKHKIYGIVHYNRVLKNRHQ